VVDRRTETSWSTLVPLQPEGSRPPFFCVHGVGGDTLSFRDLARHFAPDHPFYGIRSVSTPGQEQTCTRIEDMASSYLRAIRTLQPQGPYYLGGFSFGGSVALEMAQQLRALGEEVGLLAILDHTPPPLRYRRVVWSPGLPIHFAVNACRWFLEDIWRAGPGGRWAALRRTVRTAARQMVHIIRPPRTGRADAADVFAGRDIPEYFRRVVETNYQALRTYEPKVYPGRVTLLKAHTRPLFRLHGRDLGWTKLAGGGLEVVEVPGNHNTILKEPNVKAMATALLSRLGEVHQSTLALHG
jgi:thioesterase domain-containing protein